MHSSYIFHPTQLIRYWDNLDRRTVPNRSDLLFQNVITVDLLSYQVAYLLKQNCSLRSRWKTWRTLSCLHHVYCFWARAVHSVAIWLPVSALSPHILPAGDYGVLVDYLLYAVCLQCQILCCHKEPTGKPCNLKTKLRVGSAFAPIAQIAHRENPCWKKGNRITSRRKWKQRQKLRKTVSLEVKRTKTE